MKKYVVFWYEYESRRVRQKVRKFYVNAYNKMDAVRTAIDKLGIGRHGRNLEWIEVEGSNNYQCVTEYEEPVFEDRVNYYD